MPYKYDQSTHQIIELPEMKEPDVNSEKYNLYNIVETCFLQSLYIKDCEKYKEHIASLKTYPVGVEKVPDYWKVEGQILEEGKDFEFRYGNGGYARSSSLSQVFAIPIEENKKVEKEKEDEVFISAIELDAEANRLYPQPKDFDQNGALNASRRSAFLRGAEYILFLKNNLVECKEKEDQDELWKHVFDVFLSKGDVYIWDYKAAVTQLQNEGFSISKK